MREWARKYIGLPYRDLGRDDSGVDCWGLVRLVLLREFNQELPAFSHEYSSAEDPREVEDLVNAQMAHWGRIPPEEATEGDILLFAFKGHLTHVGLFLGGDRFLHVLQGTNSSVERMSSPIWKNRIRGVFRYGK
jgi:probable lipoprotein NlpC